MFADTKSSGLLPLIMNLCAASVCWGCVLRGWRHGSWNAASRLPQTDLTSALTGCDIETSSVVHTSAFTDHKVTSAFELDLRGCRSQCSCGQAALRLRLPSYGRCEPRVWPSPCTDLLHVFSTAIARKTAVATLSGPITRLHWRSDGIWQTATGHGEGT